MLSRVHVVISSTGSIRDIRPDVQSGSAKEFFTIVDDHLNSVSVETVIALIGIEVVANHKGVTLEQYLNELVATVAAWKKDVYGNEPKEDVKEEPKLESATEKKED